MKAKAGDWVRFMHLGHFVIGAVEYVEEGHVWEAKQCYTTAGIVNERHILEVRSQDNQKPEKKGTI